MYRIIKVLNNNGVLVLEDGSATKMIFLGNGVGFGRKPGERVKSLPAAKQYELVTAKATALQQVNEIDPIYIEAAGRIIEEAEKSMGPLSGDILIPMADHIALAVGRARKNQELLNPFLKDIEILFGREYNAALRGSRILEEMTGVLVCDDEVGYITLHIHSGLSEENVAESLETARLVQECIHQIEKGVKRTLAPDSLAYNRLASHLRYMIARMRKEERASLDLDEYARTTFPESYELAKVICHNTECQLKLKAAKEEVGYLAIHIQRVR